LPRERRRLPRVGAPFVVALALLLAGGAGTAEAAFAPATTLTAGDFPTSIAVGDFNGDGKQDIARQR
jgi:hypothetical protein